MSYVISIVTCSIPIAFILKKLESRYTQLAPEDNNKVVDNQLADGHETNPPVKSTELTGAEHVTDGDVAVTPLEGEIGEHKE